MKQKETPKAVSSSMKELMGGVAEGLEKAKQKAEVKKAEIQEGHNQERTLIEADRIKEERKQAERDRIAEKKATRTEQRSIKFDKVTLVRLDMVKKKWKQGGVVRPAVDDIIYTAVAEYLDRHYEETRDIAEKMVELGM